MVCRIDIGEVVALEGDADDAAVMHAHGRPVVALTTHLPRKSAYRGSATADKPDIEGAAPRPGRAGVGVVGQVDVVRRRTIRHTAGISRPIATELFEMVSPYWSVKVVMFNVTFWIETKSAQTMICG